MFVCACCGTNEELGSYTKMERVTIRNDTKMCMLEIQCCAYGTFMGGKDCMHFIEKKHLHTTVNKSEYGFKFNFGLMFRVGQSRIKSTPSVVFRK